MYQKFIAKFNNTSFTIITIICFLLPVFFLPATISGLGAVKGVLLYVGVFSAFSCWLIAQFIQGSFAIPKGKALLALAAWVVLALASALASQNVSVSLWGRGFAVDSFATVLILSLFAFLVAAFAREHHRLVKLFLAAFSGSVLTVALQFVLYISQNVGFVGKYLGHVASQGTLVGSWVDFAYFVTFTFLFSLLMHEVLAPKGFFKFMSFAAMILSLVILVFLNFKTAWIIAIVSALLVFVYKSSVERSISRFSLGVEEEQENDSASARFPIMSFIALLVGLFFFLSSGSIGASVSRFAGVSFTDIRPSFSTTTHVMRSALAHDPVWGAGAGRYGEVWNMYHPADINQTIFWNTSFESGYSLFQSFLTTNGILATLALLAALAFSLIVGFRLFSYQFPDRFSRFIAVTALIMLVAFVCLFLLASPGIVLIALGFMYMGLLLGVSTLVGKTKTMQVNYLRDPRMSFFAILILVVAAMAGFSAVYFSGNRFASVIYYNRGLLAGDAQTAQARIDRALSLSQNDIYWRTRTALFTSQFTNAASKENADKAQLQNFFSQAEQSASAATSWDPSSAANWLTLSQVYQLVAGGENADAFNNAKQAADRALALNPNNPLFYLNLAQLSLVNKDTDGAYANIARALELKPDYLDAYVLRAQIKISKGETTAARTELNNYIAVAPFDAQGYLLLGSAELELKNYSAALEAFSRAKELAPNDPSVFLQYVSALELSGNKTQAVEALRAFKERFPNVEGVEEQIKRIQSGASAAPASTTTTTTTTNQ
jgi:tetratricopeptide (TPR) repeat protein